MTNREMSLKTKKSLSTALKKAMEKKPLSKITVRELISECNINRNTFYYHFHDIYDLLKWTFDMESSEILKKSAESDSAEEVFIKVTDYAEANKYIINCAYDSMGYEEIKRFFHSDFCGIIRGVIDKTESELSLCVPEDFKAFTAAFFTEAIEGIFINWIKNRLEKNRDEVIRNILFICRVSIPEILKAKASEK